MKKESASPESKPVLSEKEKEEQEWRDQFMQEHGREPLPEELEAFIGDYTLADEEEGE